MLISYLLDSDLCSEWPYVLFIQQGPGISIFMILYTDRWTSSRVLLKMSGKRWSSRRGGCLQELLYKEFCLYHP